LTPVRILFYAPFKPLDHPHPSGDQVIAAGLYRFLELQGHRLLTASALRCRWIFWQPWRWPAALRELRRARRRLERFRPDLWLTYHTYYKAPDLLGPRLAVPAGVPYVVFQGIYSTRRRRKLATWPGFQLNRRALRAAAHVFSNRREDLVNLGRLLPADRLTYVRPGIAPGAFGFDPAARKALRTQWRVGTAPVVLTAAMFRPGVKTDGLETVIRACGRLRRSGRPLFLAVAGDGRERPRLQALAHRELADAVVFTGLLPRESLYRFYSAGDLFAFPGIRESLGMVYLEAQACGLPVVAYDNGGVPEVVRDGRTGTLVAPLDEDAFGAAIAALLADAPRRRQMGAAARRHVAQDHDLAANYAAMAQVLVQLAASGRHPGTRRTPP